MRNNRIAFQILEDDTPTPVGHQEIKCHMIFDIKFDFTRKARFVAGGHLTRPPTSLTYSSVVSRDSVRIAFLLAALNDLDVLAADIGNAYLNAPCREKVYFRAGLEFGPSNKGKRVVIVRALYGLRTSGAAFHAHLAESLGSLGFTPCTKADPDVWRKADIKPDGTEYYSYLLVYVDDILVISLDPSKYMSSIQSMYRLKDDSIEKPTNYLGATIREWKFDEQPEKLCWAIGAKRYILQAVKIIESDLESLGRALAKNPATPFSSGYRVELDVSKELTPIDAQRYMNLVGILRWIVELGRIDVLFEVTALSRFLVQPRTGHLDQAYRVMAYLKSHVNAWLVMDSTPIFLDSDRFPQADWMSFYSDAHDHLPPDMPKPRGASVTMTCFVDADHAGDQITRRSHTGIVILLNNAPVFWICKRQNTVETSTFGSEFIALKAATEHIEGLRYKLRMFGVRIEGPTNILCDNMSVVKSSTMPESRLKKKHNSIAFHKVREAVAAGITRIGHVTSSENLADLFTKSLTALKRNILLRGLMWITNQSGSE